MGDLLIPQKLHIQKVSTRSKVAIFARVFVNETKESLA